jgi:uncharacterized protein YtpQ (UPF0354 family)
MQDPRSIKNVFPRFYPILPRVGESDIVLSDADSPVEGELFADLVVFYAFDLGDQFELVSNSGLAELSVSKEDLHRASIQNLRALNLPVEVHAGPAVTMLTAGGNFEATLLLLPELWEAHANSVAGDLIATVPARDILLFTGNDVPDGLAELRRLNSKMLERADKPLSREFFRWGAAGWMPYKGFAE